MIEENLEKLLLVELKPKRKYEKKPGAPRPGPKGPRKNIQSVKPEIMDAIETINIPASMVETNPVTSVDKLYKELLCTKLKREITQKDMSIRKSQIEIDIIQGKYVLKTEVETSWNDILLTVKNKLLGIPSSCAVQLYGKDQKYIESYLQTYIDGILNSMADQDQNESI